MEYTDTIAAIATAMGNSGIGIVRISGEQAFSVIDSIFRNRKGERAFGNLERKSFLRRRAIRSITDTFMTGMRLWMRSF